jgi:hypothetical protein
MLRFCYRVFLTGCTHFLPDRQEALGIPLLWGMAVSGTNEIEFQGDPE